MKAVKKMSRVLSAAVVICGFSAGAFAQSSNFAIHGSFKDAAVVPAKVYLIYAPLLNQPTDSATVTNGKYEFKGYTEEPTGADLSLTKKGANDPKSKVSVILDKGELNIVSTGSIDQVEVTGSGSKAQNDFAGILKKNKAELANVQKQMQTDSFKNDADIKKRITARFYYLISESLNNLIVFARNHPESPASTYLAYTLISSGLVTHPMCDTLAQSIPNLNVPTKMHAAITDIISKQKDQDAKAAAANKELDDKMPIGSKATDFTQLDVDGKPVSLSSFKGKYVLVDFWASWCAPCRAENPNVVSAYAKYKSKGFNILGVSLDGKTTKEAWLAAIKKDGLTWTEVSDLSGWNNEAAKLYGVHAIPQNFLVDPNGNIIGKNLRGDDLNKKLASLFKD